MNLKHQNTGHTKIVTLLIEKFKASMYERSKDGSTLMHVASMNGHPDTAMLLYEKGVDSSKYSNSIPTLLIVRSLC